MHAPPGCQYNNLLTYSFKKDIEGKVKDIRICLDPRRLNCKIIGNDRHPVPLIRNLQETFAGMNFFSDFDLQRAFNQFLITLDDKVKTVFT